MDISAIWDVARDVIGWALMLVGGFFIITGAIGLVRFPDFFARIHSGGITDTLGSEIILLGLAFQADSWLTIFKLGIVGMFLVLTGPVSTHALAHAALISGVKPMLGPALRREGEDAEDGAAHAGGGS